MITAHLYIREVNHKLCDLPEDKRHLKNTIAHAVPVANGGAVQNFDDLFIDRYHAIMLASPDGYATHRCRDSTLLSTRVRPFDLARFRERAPERPRRARGEGVRLGRLGRGA
jgi:hypothetical protein